MQLLAFTEFVLMAAYDYSIIVEITHYIYSRDFYRGLFEESKSGGNL